MQYETFSSNSELANFFRLTYNRKRGLNRQSAPNASCFPCSSKEILKHFLRAVMGCYVSQKTCLEDLVSIWSWSL